jgi:hypothetical protein
MKEKCFRAGGHKGARVTAQRLDPASLASFSLKGLTSRSRTAHPREGRLSEPEGRVRVLPTDVFPGKVTGRQDAGKDGIRDDGRWPRIAVDSFEFCHVVQV